MPTRLNLRIQDCVSQMSPAERRLAELLLEREDDLLSHSAAELARLSGISKATATRFFRHLGYRDFNEVKLQAREERNRVAPDHRTRPAPTRSPKTGLDDYLRLEMENITHSLELMRADVLSEAALAIANARNVWLLGGSGEQGLAQHLRQVLARYRGNVRSLPEGSGLAEDLALVSPRDAVIVLSVRPRPLSFDGILAYLKTALVSLIHFTDPASATWARRAGGHVLLCRTEELFSHASYTSFISAGQLLIGMAAQHMGAAAQRRVDLISEIHEEIEDLRDT